ncbi:hypothetical protein FO519_002157 [Halicephalobus sp. NKZ332]|nr:hypothetical protein FO519_002157 [Halicephalobus sp. NKZ332]
MNTVKADELQRQQLEHFILVENCLIAEIHRVAQKTPIDFIDPSNSRFLKLLADFSYFEDRTRFDHIVESEEEIRLLDDDFYSQFNPFLRSFHKLTDEICSFIFEFVDYSEKCTLNLNLLDRKFVKLNNLKSEALYLLGVVLLLIDSKFPGPVKERIFVAYYRSSVDLRSRHFELLVSLLRSRKEGFETCFTSIKINIRFTEHVVNFLKNHSLSQQQDGSQDFFGEKQSAMIYVILFFHPDILHNQQGTMRQVVDKFFQERWIIPLHIELTANLMEKWVFFKSANFVLNSVLDSSVITRKSTEFGSKLRSMVIPGGLLNIDNLGEYGKLVFEFNFYLRWLILHSADPGGKKISNLPQIVQNSSRFSSDELFSNFVKISQFEHKFRQSCVFLVKNKSEESKKLKSKIEALFEQVIHLLSNNLFESHSWNEKLKNWMITIKDCISGLDGEDPETPQVLEHLAEKILEVAEMHDSDQKVLKQYLTLVLSDMEKLRNICLMDSDFVLRLDERRDSGFAWDLLQSWKPALENLLKKDAIALKFVFLKLSSSIENILKSINTIYKEKSEVLSEYYHRKLELHLRKIIQTIPRSIFAQMNSLHPLFSTNKIVHVEKQNLKQFADLERRRKLAQKTYEITKLSLGISSMCLSKLGPIEIKPTELLFDGLRQELNLKLQALLGEELLSGNILRTLSIQTTKINTFRDAFLFVCEHIGFNGVALWQSELESVFNAAFQVEKNNLKMKNQQVQVVQKNAPPKPIMGQVINSMVKQTNPRTSVYFCMKDEWYSVDLRKLEFSSDFFSVVEKWLPAISNVGLRRLINFSIYSHTKSAIQELTKNSLSKIIDESLRQKIENVVQSTENLVNSILVDKKQGLKLDSKHLEHAQDFVAMLERLGLSKKLLKNKTNVPNFSGFAIFAVLVHYLLTVTTSKKAEFSDNYVIVTGLIALAESLNVKKKVKKLCSLLLPEANVMANLKYMPSVRNILDIQNIPEALKR